MCVVGSLEIPRLNIDTSAHSAVNINAPAFIIPTPALHHSSPVTSLGKAIFFAKLDFTSRDIAYQNQVETLIVHVTHLAYLQYTSKRRFRGVVYEYRTMNTCIPYNIHTYYISSGHSIAHKYEIIQ